MSRGSKMAKRTATRNCPVSTVPLGCPSTAKCARAPALPVCRRRFLSEAGLLDLPEPVCDLGALHTLYLVGAAGWASGALHEVCTVPAAGLRLVQ